MGNKNKGYVLISSLVIIIFLINSSCIPINNNPESSVSPTESKQYQQDITFAETNFILKVQESVPEEMVFELIDDVTGIELNPTRYVMEKTDDLTYKITIPLKIGSIVKYRYLRNGPLPVYETNSFNQIIDYRAVYINGANEFYDLISNWVDKQFEIKYGRIEGQIINSLSGSPLPNILVIAGGVHSFTNSMGNFSIEQLPPGKHTLLAISTDGEYQVFQQEAIVGEYLTTPAKMAISPIDFVKVTFIVEAPPFENQTLKIIGNTYQLGNVFGNLFYGESTIASRAPTLNSLPDGTFSITLNLPVGFNLVYKYTLGNGFWNAELSEDGKFFLRDIIVPSEDVLIYDIVSTFQAPETEKIQFNVEISPNTPETDQISIQFSPFGWSSPIPMTKINKNHYVFTLFGPLNMVEDVNYRYCRNDACDISSNLDSTGKENSEDSFKSSDSEQAFSDVIENWKNWEQDISQTEIITPQINFRGGEFLVGFEESSLYNVFYPTYSDLGYSSMKELNANVVIIPIEWTLQSLNPVIIGPVPGRNPLWKDSLSQISKAKSQDLKVIISPKLNISTLALNQLFDKSLDSDWEEKFSKTYSEFLIYSSDLAQFQSVQGLLIPTLVKSGSNLEDISFINSLIEANLSNQVPELKKHFNGDLFVSFNPDDTKVDAVPFNLFDKLILIADWNISEFGNNTESFSNSLTERMEGQVFEIFQQTQMPIILLLDYPAAVGVETGCVVYEDDCINFELANGLTVEQGIDLEKNLEIQKEIYNAALNVMNEFDWIQGFISSGYNPQLSVRDSSSSVRGKPAGDLLWYWYPNILSSP